MRELWERISENAWHFIPNPKYILSIQKKTEIKFAIDIWFNYGDHTGYLPEFYVGRETTLNRANEKAIIYMSGTKGDLRNALTYKESDVNV